MKIFTFNFRYFVMNIGLFAVLALIALYVHDQFIRPFMGDVLVVIWIYLFFKTFLKVKDYKLATFVLGFAWSVEIAQYFNLVKVLGLEDIRAARIIIGSTFDRLDLLAYFIGWVFIIYCLKRPKKLTV